ncbi:MAG: A24 family peptidase [Spirochaetia bacterium]|nr:A24 family peptidase [Spirochaetia bacterium]MDY4210708.1 A24 family peptidase [Treponema sp.]
MTLRFFSFLYLSVISIFDLRTGRIPNLLTAGFFAAMILSDIFTVPSKITNHLLSAIFFFAVFYLAKVITKGLGFGDVKAASVLGYSTGFLRGCIGFVFASIAGIIFFSALNILKRENAKIPFAPFMLAGFAAEILCRRFS